jgi:hypothetical protein
MPADSFSLAPEDERKLAASLFNRVWTLLEQPSRSVGDDDAMVHAAHASAYHWGVVGGPAQWARAEWQCSRVYAVLGRFEPALHHAGRCLALAAEHGLGPFDVGAAHEAMARSYLVTGDTAQAAEHAALGRAEAARIDDAEDRAVLDEDLASLGLTG